MVVSHVIVERAPPARNVTQRMANVSVILALGEERVIGVKMATGTSDHLAVKVSGIL